ncbi:MAG: hypothetical protein SV375_09380 [Thermodesulfobacteriota bacterium]|nr:hypothetical protein [Thermodesulfobacteriota bacterium]
MKLDCFHAGLYHGKDYEETFRIIRKAIAELHECISRRKWRVKMCPETGGKYSQFGSSEEILGLKKETGCGITVDFSHPYAGYHGKKVVIIP